MKSNICRKCGYVWESRKLKPKCCPQCKSYRWNQEIESIPDSVIVRPAINHNTDAIGKQSQGEYIDVNENELQYDFNDNDIP